MNNYKIEWIPLLQSFSMASLNSSQFLASATTNAAALSAIQYLSAASGDPWDNQAQKASFFSLTASFNCWPPPVGPPITATAGMDNLEAPATESHNRSGGP